ncbi:hypothetical protein Peur_059142 [Populus x canadensis]|uniref:Bifunctional inhibitor/plant lipid transfer protein/seed storage helical domain-containing protein n=1 Tax=Populus deltoides TaxID=3696 RepID=A0A8T2X961_POPDE|nr:hypothetical protein H0E87_024802 [Populus deltoides]
MGTVKILAIALSAAFLLLDPMTKAVPDPPQRSLCMPQYSLVNHACSVILGYSLPNHPLTSDDGHGHGHGHGNGGHGHSHGRRRHRHRQRHGGSHNGSSSEDNCCKWLKELDEECVCDVLYRLPPFLSKPTHTYTVYVAEACNVTYSCDMHL